MLVNVEAAYWNLYAAYYNLFAQEEGLRQAFEGYRFIQVRVDAGNDPPQNADQARPSSSGSSARCTRPAGRCWRRERQLRGLLGLRSDDGTRTRARSTSRTRPRSSPTSTTRPTRRSPIGRN